MKTKPSLLVVLLAWAGLAPAWGDETGLAVLKARESRIRAVVEKAVPAVVAITCDSPVGTGSGVIVSEDGLVLSAAHVTDVLEKENQSKEVVIVFPDGQRGKAEILGSNRTCDTAMLRITEPALREWPFVELGDSDAIKKGEWTVALGHPGGFEAHRSPPVRAGRVWHRDNFGAFFTDCTLVGGDSGGPLLDLDGKLIGIHSSIGGPLTVNRHVAIDQFRLDWERLKQGEAWGRLVLGQSDPDRPVLGLQLDEEGSGGLRVLDITPGGPSDVAGIKRDDLLVRFAGQEVKNYLQFIRLISRHRAGDTVALELRRGEAERPVVELTLASRQSVRQLGMKHALPPPPKVWLGAEIENAVPAGARVTNVETASPAAAAGLRFGDVILELNGQSFPDAVSLARRLGDFDPGAALSLHIRRNDAPLELHATLVAPLP